jgi:hypothetical protein
MNAQSARDLSAGDFLSWGLKAWDFDLFHREELQRRIAGGAGAEVAWDIVDAPPIAIRLPDGRAYSYLSQNGSVAIAPGVHADAACVLEMPEDAWQAHVHEFRTVTGLIMSQSVRFVRGDMDAWDVWAPALRRLYSGNPIYDPDAPLLDSNGAPLDLRRTFTLSDADAEMSEFLNTAGFIIVRGAMAHLRDQIADEVDRLRNDAREGNIYSWWVDNETTGERFPYRLLYVSELSKLIRSLMDENPIVKRLAALTRTPLAPVHDRLEGALCVLKPFKAGEQLAPSVAGNLHWHADCGMGGCPVTCPAINIGIHIDAAGPDSSQLFALAGSQRRSIHDHFKRGLDWRNAVPMDTNAGDMTIHFTCMQHAGPPPTGNNGRRTLYLPFYTPETLRLFGRYQGFQQLLPGFGTGEIPSVTDVAKELAH